MDLMISTLVTIIGLLVLWWIANEIATISHVRRRYGALRARYSDFEAIYVRWEGIYRLRDPRFRPAAYCRWKTTEEKIQLVVPESICPIIFSFQDLSDKLFRAILDPQTANLSLHRDESIGGGNPQFAVAGVIPLEGGDGTTVKVLGLTVSSNAKIDDLRKLGLIW